PSLFTSPAPSTTVSREHRDKAMSTRKDLGAILVEEQIISATDLTRAETQAKARGVPLWVLLIELKLISENEIYFLLAGRAPGRVVTDEKLDKMLVPEPLRKVFSRQEAERLGAFPIEQTAEGQTIVAMVDPTDEGALSRIVSLTRARDLRPMLG